MQLENYYISGLPIDLTPLGLGNIYQPTIKEMFTLGLTHAEILSPFIILEKVYDKSDVFCKFQLIEQFYDIHKQLESVKGMELSEVDLSSFVDIYEEIVKSLRVLYQTKDIHWTEIGDKRGILIRNEKGSCLIFNENFSAFSNVVFEMFCINKADLLKEDDGEVWKENTGTQREKELIEYFKEKEKKRKEKERLNLCDYINLITVLGRYKYDDVLNMTYYQLMSAFKGYMQLNNHNEELGYRWSFKYNIEEKQKNWIKESKLDESTVKF